ncbi:hypothetical protein C8Q79DRAFT_1013004 [Trametes meyenii]|nr:hypothetical protein C8Q79DRAFT_1013004 [Trametes meyenii]
MIEAKDKNEDRKSVMTTWLDQWTEIRAHAKACISWEAIAKAEAERVTRLQRRQDKGYEAEVARVGPGLQALNNTVRPLIDKAQPLSEPEWQVISPVLVAFFERRRYLRLRQDKRSKMAGCLISLKMSLDDWQERTSPTGLIPSVSDLAGLPAVIRDVFDVVERSRVRRQYYQMLPNLVEAWRRERVKELISLMTSSVPREDKIPVANVLQPDREYGPLSLPTSFFFCAECKDLVPALAASGHHCCTKYDDVYKKILYVDGVDDDWVIPDVDGDLYEQARLLACRGYRPWSASCLRSCKTVVSGVLQACGVNTTRDAVDWKQVDDARIACMTCSPHRRAVVVMGWRRAVHHAFVCHDGVPVPWRAVSTRIVTRVKLLERTRLGLTEAETERNARWVCRLCNTWPYFDGERSRTRADLDTHMRLRHALNNFGQQDYYKSSDSPLLMHPQVLVVASDLYPGSLNEVHPDGQSFLQRAPTPTTDRILGHLDGIQSELRAMGGLLSSSDGLLRARNLSYANTPKNIRTLQRHLDRREVENSLLKSKLALANSRLDRWRRALSELPFLPEELRNDLRSVEVARTKRSGCKSEGVECAENSADPACSRSTPFQSCSISLHTPPAPEESSRVSTVDMKPTFMPPIVPPGTLFVPPTALPDRA